MASRPRTGRRRRLPLGDAEALSPANLKPDSTPFEFTVGTFGDSELKSVTGDDNRLVLPSNVQDNNNQPVDFAGDKVNTAPYTASVSFTCTGTVYITSVEAVDAETMSYGTDYANIGAFDPSDNIGLRNVVNAPHQFGEIESVTVASPPRDVYHRNFNLHRGPSLYLSDDALDRTVNMNYYTLEADMSLDMDVVYREFSKTVNDDASAVAAITPGLCQYDDDGNPDAANLTNYVRPVSVYADAPFAGKTKISSMIDPLLTLKVGWATYESDTACSFVVTSDAPRQTASKVDFEVAGVGKGTTKNFNAK